MKINYDKTADAVYIKIKNGVVKKTTKLSSVINADLDKNGKLLGVEILNVSIKLSKNKKISSPLQIPLSISV